MLVVGGDVGVDGVVVWLVCCLNCDFCDLNDGVAAGLTYALLGRDGLMKGRLRDLAPVG